MSRQDNPAASPRLLVRHGPHLLAEHRYVLNVVLGEHLGLTYEAEPGPDLGWVELRCPQANPKKSLLLGTNLLSQSPRDWLSTRTMPSLPLGNWDPETVLPGWKLGALPVLYPPSPTSPPQAENQDSLCLPLDLFGAVFFLLTRYEELVIKRRDHHQRFPASESLAVRAGFLMRPLVDEYVELLRLALVHSFPGLSCRRPESRIRLSHDIDHPFQFVGKSLPKRLVSAGRRLCRNPRRSEAWRRLRAALHYYPRQNFTRDPFATYAGLMDASEALNTPGEFYFMGGTTNRRYEEAYDLLEPHFQSVLHQIHSRGHTLGLHSSYDSFRSETVLGSELERLLTATERAGVRLKSVGGRQHYLRWVHPTSWRCWNQVGLGYDASLGFPEHIGFRCGTAREFPVFDPTCSRQLRLRERPLVAMDVTLTEYMGLGQEEILAKLEHLWSTIKRLGGTLEVLIHNCNPLALWLAQALAKLKPA